MEPTVAEVFDPHFTKPVTAVVVAPRGSGKSFFMDYVMHENRNHFDDVFCYYGSEDVRKQFAPKLPATRLVGGYESGRMAALMDLCKRTTEVVLAHPGERTRPWHVALILDDLGFDASIFRCTTHLEAWMNSRHCFLSLFICIQFVTTLPPKIRGQADLVIAFNNPILDDRKKLFKMFFGIFPSERLFSAFMARACVDFGAIIFNTRCARPSVANSIMTFRAKSIAELPPEEKRLCCPRVWELDRAIRLRARLKQLERELRVKQLMAKGGVPIDGL